MELIHELGPSQQGLPSAVQLSARPLQRRSQIPSHWYLLPRRLRLRHLAKLIRFLAVNLSILKFLGFEQIFKNALTGCKLPRLVLLETTLMRDK
jgi:hypothetical protein